MARVKIEDVIQHLDHDMKRALEAALQEVLPDAQVDRNALFRAFARQVGRKCSTWENIPDNCVDN